MPRTSITIRVTKDYDVNAVQNVFARIVSSNGYKEKIIKGEQCWSKGDGVVLKQQNFGIIFSKTEITLQGWMGDAITGESNLDGFVAMLPKKKMKKSLEEARSAIAPLV